MPAAIQIARDVWRVPIVLFDLINSFLIRAEDGIARADLATLCSLLTWMVRGERFCDGHWAAMLEQGHLRRWLERLAAFA